MDDANPPHHTRKLYIAGAGLITPLGNTPAMSSTILAAGISAQSVSRYYKTQDGHSIVTASVPDLLLADFQGEITEGSYFNSRHDRVVKLAVMAIRDAFSLPDCAAPIPLLLGMPEPHQSSEEGLVPMAQTLAHNFNPVINTGITRSFYSGRASGLEAIHFAFRYLFNSPYPYVLVGASDSHEDDDRLLQLEQQERLQYEDAHNGFVPGEAASFLLLTPHRNLASQMGGTVIALSAPAMSEEPGHMFSQEPYFGEGLHQAFKAATVAIPPRSIHSIYSSMNGEHYWAKEYGVAYLRNREVFMEPVNLVHPADSCGDLGAATATTLITLAAQNLLKNPKAQAHLVYCSSDSATRGAIVIEKIYM